ncbi:MAG: MBOAT family O-acyltransferase [Eubacteriales bacterium]|nr:MBOAT family O-acyltransferase [Eubacteriales bacterium]
MDFVSLYFYVFLAAVLVGYYLMPLRFRWIMLLAGSLSYFWLATESFRGMIVFLGIIAVTWILGIWMEHVSFVEPAGGGKYLRRAALAVSLVLALVPLFAAKYRGILSFFETILHRRHSGMLISIGLSFFTMQIIAYLVDIWHGKVKAQRNLFKYALFISFFPQILQGPIPRYEQLEPQLIEGHRFDEEKFVKGFMLIIWGFFLKLMIADKAGVVVDTIFRGYQMYRGCYVLVGGVLYSIQLYADFLACVTLAQGTALLFGIRLAENFRHPYFSSSIKEFWGRWHISLSSWLKDYVYIPLGGNRKGTLRKYLNLCITFAVSGLWHGNGLKYVFWGLVHAGYQIAGNLTWGIRDWLYHLIGLDEGRRLRLYMERTVTFLLVMLAWIMFRAESFRKGASMIKSLFTVYNPWIFFDDSLFSLGLEWKEWGILILAILILISVSTAQERGIVIRDKILRQPLVFRWGLYLAAIAVIMVFGTYGYGFDAADFIYGNF